MTEGWWVWTGHMHLTWCSALSLTVHHLPILQSNLQKKKVKENPRRMRRRVMKLTRICSVYQRPQTHPKCNWGPWVRSQDLQPQTPHNSPRLHLVNTLWDKPSPSLSADNTSLPHQISADTFQENNPIFHFNQEKKEKTIRAYTPEKKRKEKKTDGQKRARKERLLLGPRLDTQFRQPGFWRVLLHYNPLVGVCSHGECVWERERKRERMFKRELGWW